MFPASYLVSHLLILPLHEQLFQSKCLAAGGKQSSVTNPYLRRLVGPSVPVGQPIVLATRYTRTMLELPSPQITVGPRTHLASTITSGPVKADWLVSIAQKPLKPTGQPKSGAWGFFEQGIILGALVYTLPLLAASLFGVGYAGLLGYRKFC